MVKKILIALVLIPMLALVFAPKKELYFMLQKRLATQDIVLSNGNISENPFGLSIEGPELFYKGIRVAKIKKISLWTLLAYTNGNVDTISFDPSLGAYLPKQVKSLSFTHGVINPTEVLLKIQDSAMQGSGTFDLKSRVFKFHFTKMPPKSPIMTYLKSNKGVWDYEQRF